MKKLWMLTLILLGMLLLPALAGAVPTPHDISIGPLNIDAAAANADGYIVTGSTTNNSNVINVTGAGNVSITLNNVNMTGRATWVNISDTANVTITLAGAIP